MESCKPLRPTPHTKNHVIISWMKKKKVKKKKKQKYSSGFLKAIKELELAGVIKETKKNTFKLVKNKHEKEETIY